MNSLVNFKELAVKHQLPQVTKIENPFSFEKDAIDHNNLYSDKPGYKLIDLSFLAMHENGFPKFAVFDVTKEDCTISLQIDYKERDKNIDFRCNFHYDLRKYFLPTYIMLKDKVLEDCPFEWFSTKVSISSTFSGIIPKEIRNKIRNLRLEFDYIYIIAEASNWKFESKLVTYPKNPDPLIVGSYGGKFYLIDTFDLTTREKYIVSEFTCD